MLTLIGVGKEKEWAHVPEGERGRRERGIETGEGERERRVLNNI